MAKKEEYYKGTKYEGVIEKIIDDKGYGYIKVENHEGAKFSINDVKEFEPKEGQHVEFVASSTEMRTKAHSIKLIEKNESSGGSNMQSEGIYLPQDTKRAIENISRIDNYYLSIQKYVRFDGKNKAILPRHNDVNFNKAKDKIQKYYDFISQKFVKNLEDFTLQTSWRMVVGLGGESVYETSMTLHHIYGIPYIPGQALKGIARSWLIKEHIPADFDFKQKEANKRLEEAIISQNLEFREIFGNSKTDNIDEQSGKVIFFDAFPIESPQMTKDIMTPHYSPYYSDNKNKKPPADYYNPTPIQFLVIENTKFRFMLGVKNSVDNNEAKELLGKAKSLLENALKNSGVGAKTAVGYGYFEEI